MTLQLCSIAWLSNYFYTNYISSKKSSNKIFSKVLYSIVVVFIAAYVFVGTFIEWMKLDEDIEFVLYILAIVAIFPFLFAFIKGLEILKQYKNYSTK